MGWESTLAISKVCDAYDATVKDDKNSALGTEKEEDLPSKEQTIFSDLSVHICFHIKTNGIQCITSYIKC
jgi:hypothetical protein